MPLTFMFVVVLLSDSYHLNTLCIAWSINEEANNNNTNVSNVLSLENDTIGHDNQTVIADNIVGDYFNEILDDGTNRSITSDRLPSICLAKPCLNLCSRNIIDYYLSKEVQASKDVMELFFTDITMNNKAVTKKNLVETFRLIVIKRFCKIRYPLSPEKDKRNKWTLFENGNLLRHSDQVLLGKNEYCFELYADEIKDVDYLLINPFVCAKTKKNTGVMHAAYYWLQALSVIFLLLTIIAYLFLSELKDVNRKLFMHYLSCLTISFTILSYINLSNKTFKPLPCFVMAYLNYYMQLSQYTWCCIIYLDTWKLCRDYKYKSSYYKYALYGYNLPLLITFLSLLAQNSDIREDLKPGISPIRCGLNVNRWSAIIYLYGPCSVILMCCLVLIILTLRIIERSAKEFMDRNGEEWQNRKSRYGSYLQLFIILGLSWCLDILSYFLFMFKMENLSEIFDYINALQGLYVFVNFIGYSWVTKYFRKEIH